MKASDAWHKGAMVCTLTGPARYTHAVLAHLDLKDGFIKQKHEVPDDT